MRIIGVDPGLNITGIGIVEVTDGAACRYLHHCVVRTKTTEPLADRLMAIRDGVRAAALQWAAGTSAIEASFVGNNARSALALGQARAAAILGLAETGITVAEYAPTLVKQTVAGYGRSEKSQVGKMVALQLGIATVPTPEDAADALAIAITHWAHTRLVVAASR